MNAIPITLTLYYPTMAQFEAYVGFTAMLSIAFAILELSLPAWYWTPRKTISSRKSYSGVFFIGLNPIGTAVLFFLHKTTSGIDDLPTNFNFACYLLAPIVAAWVYAAL